eukprot:1812502-Pyramimonas_sp.AAC.1
MTATWRRAGAGVGGEGHGGHAAFRLSCEDRGAGRCPGGEVARPIDDVALRASRDGQSRGGVGSRLASFASEGLLEFILARA